MVIVNENTINTVLVFLKTRIWRCDSLFLYEMPDIFGTEGLIITNILGLGKNPFTQNVSQ